jgi:uncharacterized protein (TIGR00299 family) protein
MFVGALLDLGLELSRLEQELQKLPLSGYRLEASKVTKHGILATAFRVTLQQDEHQHLADSQFLESSLPHPAPAASAHPQHFPIAPARGLGEILDLIAKSELSARVKTQAGAIFTRLGEAESHVHGVALDQVHFHEVGGVDAIVDIVGACIALEQLGVDKIIASPLHLGSGFITAAHGILPVPAPATAYLLQGAPVYSTEERGELVTPTGAAILTSLAASYGPLPHITIQGIGYGAGSRDRQFPNVLRASLGSETNPSLVDGSARQPRTPFPQQHIAPSAQAGYHESAALVLECNIDDSNPQFYEHLLERLLEAGALDVVLIPALMKKSRPAILLQVLAHPDSVDDLLGIIFSESTTLGVRTYPVVKRMLQRQTRVVQTEFGPVRIKLAQLDERIVNVAPEYEDCRALARQSGRPLKEIYGLAISAYYRAETPVQP